MWGNEDYPIQRGTTFYGGRTIDSNNLEGEKVKGQIRVFDDFNPTTRVLNSNLPVMAILCRNKHNAALTPGQAVLLSGTVVGETGAPVSSTTVLCGVVDEYLPAAGCPVNDLCWVVIKGPTTVNIVTNSGTKSAGQLAIGPSATTGKMDFTGLTPGNATVAQSNATYGTNWFTEGAIADGATTARVIGNRAFFG